MNRIWHSVVGKLWATILLLVSFVLFIVTVLLLEFLDNFHTQQAEDSLRREAVTIGKLVSSHSDDAAVEVVIDDILDADTNALIVTNDGEVLHSFHDGLNGEAIQEQVLNDPKLLIGEGVREERLREVILPSTAEEDVMEQYLILATPFQHPNGTIDTIVIYQSLEAIHRTTKRTTHIVVLSAFIALMLTTFFAFFLSSRITSPLRDMKRAATELSKGNFDTTLPSAQNDEIGQLATAFNDMGVQLKEYVELIKQEKEQLSSILTSMADAVITFDTDFSIVVKNPPAESLLQRWQYQNESADGELPPQIVHMLDHVITFDEEVDDELEIGREYYAISITPLYSEHRTIRGAVAVVRNMTEQRQLDKLRSDFIANVSHELRTPIAMLQGYSEAIIDGVTQSEEETHEMVQIIHDESKRMSRLVNDLLDLARMESGHMRLYKERVSMHAFIDRIATKFSQRAKDVNVSLVVDVPDDPVYVELDEDRIEQVLTNLVDNAIRHTPERGTVTLHVRAFDEAVEVAVADTGVGIPEDDLPFIFERFYKADKARTRGKSGGTGLGLAIAKNIIDSHEGLIYAKKGKTEGTVFTFVLPR